MQIFWVRPYNSNLQQQSAYMLTFINLLVIIFFSISNTYASEFIPKTAEGYKVSPWAKVQNPRQMSLSSKGNLFVGSFKAGVVTIVKNGKPEVILTKLKQPSGLVMYKNDLYIAETHQISVIRDIEKKLEAKTTLQLEVIRAGLPTDYQNSSRRISMDQKESLYVSIGAPCNVCVVKDPYSSIQKLSLDGKKMEMVAHGVRFVGAMAWHPTTKELWFSDLNRDNMGFDLPSSEINILKPKAHYGFPYFHGTSVKDPHFYREKPAVLKTTSPEIELPAHSSPTGIAFLQKKKNCLLLALNGSNSGGKWFEPQVEERCGKNKKIILSGFLVENSPLGRPYDIIEQGDHWLISDDYANIIWKLEKLK
jgi:glucose/arabinose dehydrogenase